MATVVAYLLLPVVVFFGLVALPRGRAALVGIVLAAVAVALLVPMVFPEDGSGFGGLLLWSFGGAVGLAAVAQGLRMVPLSLAYPILVALVLLAGLVPAAKILGMF